MKKYPGIILMALSGASFVYCANAYADFSGTVKQVVCHVKEVSPICQVMVNGTPTGQPACASDAWRYTFDGASTEGKNILSILLAGQLARQTIVIGGRGTCLLSAHSEDIRHVYMVTQ